MKRLELDGAKITINEEDKELLERHEENASNKNDLHDTILDTMPNTDEEKLAFDSYQTKVRLKSLA